MVAAMSGAMGGSASGEFLATAPVGENTFVGCVSAGVKFTDAERIGIGWTVVIGRGFAEGRAEIRKGRTGERHYVPITDVSRVIAALLG